MRPITVFNNKCTRTYHEVTVRPIKKSGMKQLRDWFENQNWSDILNQESVDDKAQILQGMILDAVNEYLPEKVIKIASDDEPWVTQPLKRLDRRRRRELV